MILLLGIFFFSLFQAITDLQMNPRGSSPHHEASSSASMDEEMETEKSSAESEEDSCLSPPHSREEADPDDSGCSD